MKSTIKKILYRLTTQKFRDRIKFSRIDFSATPPILVFQMGKVGSTSIRDTLKAMNLGRPIYQAHYLSRQGIELARLWHRHHQGKVPYGVEYYQLLGRKIQTNLDKAHYTIITGVRDPIAKEISNYFELAEKIDHGLRAEDGTFDIERVDSYLLDRFNRFDEEEDGFFTTKWFDQELKGTFGIDVYEHPFNRYKGYSIIRYDNLDLLVYQYEKLQQIFPDALSKLLDLELTAVPELKRHNIGMSKWYAEAYAEVKRRIRVPVEVCRKVYRIRFVRHFYSDQMIEDWVRHWSRSNDS